MLTRGIQKNGGTDEPICKAEIEIQIREQMHGLQWGEGEAGMNWEIGIDSLMCKINN